MFLKDLSNSSIHGSNRTGAESRWKQTKNQPLERSKENVRCHENFECGCVVSSARNTFAHTNTYKEEYAFPRPRIGTVSTGVGDRIENSRFESGEGIMHDGGRKDYDGTRRRIYRKQCDAIKSEDLTISRLDPIESNRGQDGIISTHGEKESMCLQTYQAHANKRGEEGRRSVVKFFRCDHLNRMIPFSPSTTDEDAFLKPKYANLESLLVDSSGLVKDMINAKHVNDGNPHSSYTATHPVVFVVRSRPLESYEVQRGDFQVVDIYQESSNTLALYEASNFSERGLLDLKIHRFKYDGAFSEKCSSKQFYNETAREQVQAAVNGNVGILIVHGNDKYGLSRTMSDIEYNAAFDIFADNNCCVTMKCFGLGPCSTHCVDLLNPKLNAVEIVQPRRDYHDEEVSHVALTSVAEFLSALQHTKWWLASETICEAVLNGKVQTLLIEVVVASEKSHPGKLFVAFCASSNIAYARRSKSNDAKPLALENIVELYEKKAAAETNLKDYLNYPCALTKLLAPRFLASDKSKICLIAAFSPSSTDFESTLAGMLTLKKWKKRIERAYKIELALIEENEKLSNSDLSLPRQWSNTRLNNWLLKKGFRDLNDKSGISGNSIMKMSVKELNESFFGSDQTGEVKAKKLYTLLRTENDRRVRLRVKRKFAQRKTKEEY